MKAQDEKESLKNKSEQARKGFRPTGASQIFLEFSGNSLGMYGWGVLIWDVLECTKYKLTWCWKGIEVCQYFDLRHKEGWQFKSLEARALLKKYLF